MSNTLIETIVNDAAAGQNNSNKEEVFDKIYDQLVQLRMENGGGAQSVQFQQDMKLLNDQLHERGILSDFEITGVHMEGDPSPHRYLGPEEEIQIKKKGSNEEEMMEGGITTARWYPGLTGELSPTQQSLLKVVTESVGQQLWETKHPSPGIADSPDPPGFPSYGGPGGYGCAPSVAEALRRAGAISPDEDPVNVADVQTILEDFHGWKQVPGTATDQSLKPSERQDLSAMALEPGDVILGYRDPMGDRTGGSNSHVGIVGEDGKIYAHGVPDRPNPTSEEWTFNDVTQWSNLDYRGGIVVLRAPDAK